MANRNRGHEQYQPSYFSDRQRVVLLTFSSVAEAQAWDEAGRPLDIHVDAEQVVSVARV